MKQHKTFFKVKRIKDPEYLVWLRYRPCIVAHPDHIYCEQPTYGHHSLQCEHKGMAQKAGDNHAFTVCDSLHREIHHSGNEKAVLENYGIHYDIIEFCDEQYESYKNEIN